jgi:hypothetical protein
VKTEQKMRKTEQKPSEPSEPKNLGLTARSRTQFPRFENLQIQAASKPKD